MKNKDDLVEAARANDEQMENHPPGEGSPMPSMFKGFDVDPDDAFAVAEARVMRMLSHAVGIALEDLTREDLERNASFMSHAGSAWLDGFAVASRAAQISPEQLAAAMLLPLYEWFHGKPAVGAEGKLYLGTFTDDGDRERLELARQIIEKLTGVMPPSGE